MNTFGVVEYDIQIETEPDYPISQHVKDFTQVIIKNQ